MFPTPSVAVRIALRPEHPMAPALAQAATKFLVESPVTAFRCSVIRVNPASSGSDTYLDLEFRAEAPSGHVDTLSVQAWEVAEFLRREVPGLPDPAYRACLILTDNFAVPFTLNEVP